jgi:dolichol-phosphate mannosyltransferase
MSDAEPAPSVDLSVVIPVFNERDSLEPLLQELERVLKGLGKSYEVLCVDDRSTDDSLDILRRLQKDRPYLRVICHRVISGESAGEATGFRHARGDVIVTMDADQQNDPADIPALLAALREDVAAVCGVRRVREDNWVRRLSSRIANGFRNWATGDRGTGCPMPAARFVLCGERPSGKSRCSTACTAFCQPFFGSKATRRWRSP